MPLVFQGFASVLEVHLVEVSPALGHTLPHTHLHISYLVSHFVHAGFKGFASAVDVHLVELSPALRSIQRQTLVCTSSGTSIKRSSTKRSSSSGISASSNSGMSNVGAQAVGEPAFEPWNVNGSLTSTNTSTGAQAVKSVHTPEGDRLAASTQGKEDESPASVKGSSSSSSSQKEQQHAAEAWVSKLGGGPAVHWHRALDSVPRSIPTIYIAHEFFDALPVSKRQVLSLE